MLSNQAGLSRNIFDGKALKDNKKFLLIGTRWTAMEYNLEGLLLRHIIGQQGRAKLSQPASLQG